MTRISPDELYEALFDEVQRSRIFPDSKTFCDVVPKQLTPKEILELYRDEKQRADFNLSSFINEHFHRHDPAIVTVPNQTIAEHCHRLWPLLTRKIDRQEQYSSLIDVPHPFVVPGGRFQEFYYWDTYFTMLGLVRSNQTDLLNHMLENFAHLIRTIGHIPNGNRWYYKGRSQPPFFVLMTELLGKTNQYRHELELEYQFWMTKRAITLDDGTVLNRYYDDDNTRPRPEAYLEDVETAAKAKRRDIYTHLRAAAESGWDFSSRWLDDVQDLSTIQTANILPIDLNCLLYHLEIVLGKTKEAERRLQAIHQYMWSNVDQFFTDYNFIEKKSTRKLTLAGVYPLWLDIATLTQSEQVAQKIETLFLHDGGVVTTIIKDTHQQWDHPNGWAPLQYIAYRALLKVPGYDKLARTIRDRWMSLNERVFANTGKMMEKYDVVNMNKLAGGGEYVNQDGFGWTNGVYLEMLHDRQKEN